MDGGGRADQQLGDAGGEVGRGVRVQLFFFFFQAEDGIRDYKVTGVQTCALPISDRVISRRICSTGKRLRKSETLLPPLRPRRASTRARRSSYRFMLRDPCSKSSRDRKSVV